MLLSLALSPLEKLINKLLAKDPEKAELLTEYTGKVLRIELPPTTFIFWIIVENNQLRLISDYNAPVDTIIKGSPLALLQLVKSRELHLPENIIITGNIELPQNLRNIFLQINIDWEEQFSKIAGDPLARLVFNQMRRINRWQQQAASSLCRNSREYLQEEARYLPPRAELNDFFDEVDEIHHAVERVAVRVERLLESELTHE